MKGRTSFSELQEMPYRYIQTLYYNAWKESKERKNENLEEALEEMIDK